MKSRLLRLAIFVIRTFRLGEETSTQLNLSEISLSSLKSKVNEVYSTFDFLINLQLIYLFSRRFSPLNDHFLLKFWWNFKLVSLLFFQMKKISSEIKFKIPKVISSMEPVVVTYIYQRDFNCFSRKANSSSSSAKNWFCYFFNLTGTALILK